MMMVNLLANRKPEELVATKFAGHMMTNHPMVPLRFDIGADIPLPPHLAKRSKELHGKWTKGYPDVLICSCRKGYGGLYIELKATEKVINSEHTRRQAMFHAVLRSHGYKVTFACGIDEAKKVVDKYLRGKVKKVKS